MLTHTHQITQNQTQHHTLLGCFTLLRVNVARQSFDFTHMEDDEQGNNNNPDGGHDDENPAAEREGDISVGKAGRKRSAEAATDERDAEPEMVEKRARP